MSSLITVIIPAYNVAEYLKQGLSAFSVLCERNIEIIVINDGSTDATGSVMEQFCLQSETIKVIAKENGGCASARMTGLRAAQGDYVCFVDADDWVEPAYLDELFTACERSGAPIASCFHAECYESDKTRALAYPQSFLKGPFRKLSYETIPASDTLLWKPTIWASLYRRDFLLSRGIEFPEHIRMFDDLAFHAQIAFSGAEIAVVPKHLYNYRLQRPGQDVSNRGEKLFVHFDIFDYLESKLAKEATNSLDYFLLKYQTHRWTLAILNGNSKSSYRAKVAASLFQDLDAWKSVQHVRALHKIKRRYGRDAFLLLMDSLRKKRAVPRLRMRSISEATGSTD